MTNLCRFSIVHKGHELSSLRSNYFIYRTHYNVRLLCSRDHFTSPTCKIFHFYTNAQFEYLFPFLHILLKFPKPRVLPSRNLLINISHPLHLRHENVSPTKLSFFNFPNLIFFLTSIKRVPKLKKRSKH